MVQSAKQSASPKKNKQRQTNHNRELKQETLVYKTIKQHLPSGYLT
jgi:hypothetical protein